MNEEDILILQKAIHKAEENGWENPFATMQFHLSDAVWGASIPAIIFRHDFCKAIWGEEKTRLWQCPKCDYALDWYKHNETQQFCPVDGSRVKDVEKPNCKWDQQWAKNLQEMVLQENPIKYLESYV